MRTLYPGFPKPSPLCFIGLHLVHLPHPGIPSFEQCAKCGHSWRR